MLDRAHGCHSDDGPRCTAAMDIDFTTVLYRYTDIVILDPHGGGEF